jgi:hypothetical protein
MKTVGKRTLSSVTFQSFILVFGGSFDHETYIPFTKNTNIEGQSTNYSNAAPHDPTVMEELNWLIPFIWSELPCLSRRHHAYHSFPCVHPELGQRLHTIDYKIPRRCLRLPPTGVDVCPFAVYRNEILRSRVTFCGSAGTGFLRRFEAIVQK